MVHIDEVGNNYENDLANELMLDEDDQREMRNTVPFFSQVEFSDLDEENMPLYGIDVYLLVGYNGKKPRYDLLGKYDKSTKKFGFSGITYEPVKHDGYMYVSHSDKYHMNLPYNWEQNTNPELKERYQNNYMERTAKREQWDRNKKVGGKTRKIRRRSFYKK